MANSRSSLVSATWAMLIALWRVLLGMPPRRELSYEASTSGLAKAVVAEVTISFDPPQFPPRKVTVTRGADTLEIEHLETIATKR